MALPPRLLVVRYWLGFMDDHWRWLVDSKRFKVKFAVPVGVTKSHSWEVCLAYDYDVRNTAIEEVRVRFLLGLTATVSTRGPRTQNLLLGSETCSVRKPVISRSLAIS